MRDELRKYIEEEFLVEFDDEITPDTDLFKVGVLDSFGYLMLMRHVEQSYGVRFGEEELLERVSPSLAGIVAAVERSHSVVAENG